MRMLGDPDCRSGVACSTPAFRHVIFAALIATGLVWAIAACVVYISAQPNLKSVLHGPVAERLISYFSPRAERAA